MRLALAISVALILAVGCAAGKSAAVRPQTISVTTADGQTHKRIRIGLNKTVIIDLDTPAREVLVSKPEIVDAVVRSPKRIYLMAQSVGHTNAYFMDAAGRQILTLDIEVEKDIDGLAATLRKTFPKERITVTTSEGTILLSGTMENASDIQRVGEIAANYAGGEGKIVNMLQLHGSEQVMLKVRIAELSRSVSKQLGINFTNLAGTMATPWGSTSLVGTLANGISGTPNVTAAITAHNFAANVQALETLGLMHTLAEPNLIAVSGESAKFLAGGEFPVASGRDSSGNVSVSFKQYGVGLSFTPVVLGPGRIALKLSTEVSQLTNTGALVSCSSTATSTNTDSSSSSSSSSSTSGTSSTSNCATIPALTVRRTETAIELPSGGSFAVSGLLQHVTNQYLKGVPGLMDLPVLGALFRSHEFQNDETELVVLVTAYLVSPVQEAKLDLPTDGFVTPTDLESLLLGRLNATYKNGAASQGTHGDVGFIVQ